jgi:hypothetical protein
MNERGFYTDKNGNKIPGSDFSSRDMHRFRGKQRGRISFRLERKEGRRSLSSLRPGATHYTGVWHAQLAGPVGLPVAMEPRDNREPVSSVSREPLDVSVGRAVGPSRTPDGLDARSSVRRATLSSRMWREVGHSAAAGGRPVSQRARSSSAGPPPNGSFKLRCYRNRMTSVHSRG